MTSSSNPNNANSASKIDAIKELIFGETIENYEREFETIKQDLVSKKNELNAFIDEIRKELLQNIDNLSTDLNIRITDIESNMKEKVDQINDNKLDKKTLGDLLINLGEKISK